MSSKSKITKKVGGLWTAVRGRNRPASAENSISAFQSHPSTAVATRDSVGDQTSVQTISGQNITEKQSDPLASSQPPLPVNDYESFYEKLHDWQKDRRNPKLMDVMKTIRDKLQANVQDYTDFIPNSPFPFQQLVNGLAIITQWALSIALAKQEAADFAEGVIGEMLEISFMVEEDSSFPSQKKREAWDDLSSKCQVVNQIYEWARNRLLESRIEGYIPPAEDIKAFERKLAEAHHRFVERSTIRILKEIHKLVAQTKIKAQYEHIQSMLVNSSVPLEDTRWEALRKPRCHTGTRIKTLDRIHHWASSTIHQLYTPAAPRYLHVIGAPGTGKSTVLGTAAAKLDADMLCAEYFIRRSPSPTSNPNYLFPSIALQLAQTYPEAANIVELCPRQHWDTLSKEQAKLLFVRPINAIAQLKHRSVPVVILIDALDELSSNGSSLLFTILLDAISDLHHNARIILSSRPEFDFLSKTEDNQISLDPKENESLEDVRTYIKDRLDEIAKDPKVGSSWLDDTWLQKLFSQADGLFIWASTALELIRPRLHAILRDYATKREDRPAKYRQILNEFTGPKMKGIDDLYRAVLNRFCPDIDGKKDLSMLQSVVRIIGLLLVAQEPLRLGTIIRLLDFAEDSAILTFEEGRSVLISGTDPVDSNTLPIMHKSFVDFITNRESAGDFYVDIGEHHACAVHTTFRVMKEELRFNIVDFPTSHLLNCQVKGLSDRISQKISPQLRYSCRYWIRHLEALSPQTINVQKDAAVHSFVLSNVASQLSPDYSDIMLCLDEFLKERFLFWLEVLSLTREMIIAAPSMAALYRWIDENTAKSDLLAFIEDGKTFIDFFGSAIADSTPHIYISALPFSPTSSLVANHYSSRYRHLIAVDIADKRQSWDWDNAAHVLNHPDIYLPAISFSPDGWHLAVVDGTSILIYDLNKGAVVTGPWRSPHVMSSVIKVLSWSPDGRYIGWGSEKLVIWDANQREFITVPDIFAPIDDLRLSSMAFSADSKAVVLGFRNGCIILWNEFVDNHDSDACVVIDVDSKGKPVSVVSLVFSDDGKLLFSMSMNGHLQIWDLQDPSKPFISYKTDLHSHFAIIAFSDDRSIIRIATSTHLLGLAIHVESQEVNKLWSIEVANRDLRSRAAAFSDSGKHAVFISFLYSIDIWDVDERRKLASLSEPCDSSIWSVALSGDGKWAASASVRTVRLWRVPRQDELSDAFTSRPSAFTAVSCSNKGNYFVTASEQNKIRIWCLQTGNVLCQLPSEKTGMVERLACYSDSRGNVSILSSSHQSVDLWKWNPSSKLAPLHTPLASSPTQSDVTALAFSHDGQRIGIGFRNGVTSIWSEKGQHDCNLAWQDSPISYISFFCQPDRVLVNTVSGPKPVESEISYTLTQWEISEDKQSMLIRSSGNMKATAVALSPDGELFAYTTSTGGIIVLDMSTFSQVSELISSSDTTTAITELAFPSKDTIISITRKRTLVEWNLKSGTQRRLLKNVDVLGNVLHAYNADSRLLILFQTCWSDTCDEIHVRAMDEIDILTDDFTIALGDGWVKRTKEANELPNLLFWAPLPYRQGLRYPHSYSLISEGKRILLHATDFAQGKSWMRIGSSGG